MQTGTAQQPGLAPGTRDTHRDDGGVSRRLNGMFATLGRREQDVAREILRQYPVSALCTVAGLAERSKVSTATVLRLVHRLGLRGYGAFQEAVKSDVTALLESPSQRLSAQPAETGVEGAFLARMLGRVAQNIQHGVDPVMEADFRRAVALLANPKHRITCIGGHRSCHVAALFGDYLGLLRDRVQVIQGQAGGWARPLLEIDAQSVVVVIDIRRYQPSLLRFAGLAAERGAHVVAISDIWAKKELFSAEILLRMPSSSPSPMDSHCGQLALLEALVGALAEDMGAPLLDRLSLGETLDCTDSDRFTTQ